MYYKYLLLLFLFSTCNTLQENKGEDSNTTVPSTTIQNKVKKTGQPSKKEALYLLMQHHDVPLSVHESCNGVATGFDDTTIGHYISGFWAYQTEEGTNGLRIEVIEGDDEGITEKHWEATIMLSGVVEEEPWNWGVSFTIMDEGLVVVKESFKCLGAG